MILWKRPAADIVARFVQEQSARDWSYPGIGGTRTRAVPRGFVADHYRARLGDGDAVFEAARDAIRKWSMFDVGWVDIVPAPSPPRQGLTVGVQFRLLGLWWLNACRVVYMVDEAGPPRRFGFAYGTLPDHLERGEERFLVERDRDGATWYDITVFSQPAHPLTRLANPAARLLQRRFARQSMAAMQRAVRRPHGGDPRPPDTP